jgi:hypothetical protein
MIVRGNRFRRKSIELIPSERHAPGSGAENHLCARPIHLTKPTQKDNTMKNAAALLLSATLVLPASTVFAGGPVIIAEEPEVVAEAPASSVGILPLLLVGVVLCVALCGGSSDDRPRDSEIIPPGKG